VTVAAGSCPPREGWRCLRFSASPSAVGRVASLPGVVQVSHTRAAERYLDTPTFVELTEVRVPAALEKPVNAFAPKGRHDPTSKNTDASPTRRCTENLARSSRTFASHADSAVWRCLSSLLGFSHVLVRSSSSYLCERDVP
jgi:hypothetical protein